MIESALEAFGAMGGPSKGNGKVYFNERVIFLMAASLSF
jgi:hypothetical protein